METGTFLPSDNPKVPAAQFPFHHCLPVQMRFTDIDMLGHLNNNVYLTFMDLAKVNYFSDVLPEGMDWNSINAVVVHIGCDFYSPSYFNESLEVWTTVTTVGERSFKMEQRIVNSVTCQTKCVGTTVMAGFDPATAQSKAIDRHWVECVEKYEGRKL
ncbi:MAG: acyl-CoA thioesterase [Muribaculaceae bacterium]|jgi:acyl-CoA thioester hydrolase|nr:acyl-CoA thioesterase [Muribaculaceae bacterium]